MRYIINHSLYSKQASASELLRALTALNARIGPSSAFCIDCAFVFNRPISDSPDWFALLRKINTGLNPTKSPFINQCQMRGVILIRKPNEMISVRTSNNGLPRQNTFLCGPIVCKDITNSQTSVNRSSTNWNSNATLLPLSPTAKARHDMILLRPTSLDPNSITAFIPNKDSGHIYYSNRLLEPAGLEWRL